MATKGLVAVERSVSSSGCFVCGRDNPSGLKLSFRPDGDGVSVTARPGAAYQGFGGVLHGGIVAALMDDAMWHAIYHATGKLTMTAELTVRYKAPVPADAALRVRGQLVQNRKGRLFTAQAGIYDAGGTLLAEASATFLPAPAQAAERLAAELSS